ncbi:MAG: ATP-binding cassette domain-containing protein [Thermomicrobiales bacterium]|nr:ATP-binding cassette domain-containing protein [Thermomicrobiales bacterium]
MSTATLPRAKTAAPLPGARSPQPEAAIEVRDLVRTFGEFTAVDHLSFTVPHGEIFGFLGPNGAGKSTTIKMLCTLLRPTSGTASVNGFDAARQPNEVRASIGIIFQDYSLDERITAEENLRFHCMIYHVPRAERRQRIAQVLEMVDLADRAHDKVGTFSGGMKRRLEIARGLLHHPAVLFLDEPTVGLDPQTRERLWEQIHTLRRQQAMTVFMTTHYMDEAEHCDRIGIIDHARMIALDTPQALKAMIGGDVVRLGLAESELDAARAFLWQAHQITATAEGSTLRFEVRHADRFVPELLQAMPQTVSSLEIAKPTLNDVFLQLTGRAIRDEGAGGNEKLRAALRRRGGKGA